MALSTLRILRLLLASLIFLIMGAVFYEIITISPEQQIRKYDEANINHMKYGLFNINTWKEKMTEIVIAEIEDFEISDDETPVYLDDILSEVIGQQVLIDVTVEPGGTDSTGRTYQERSRIGKISSANDVSDSGSGW